LNPRPKAYESSALPLSYSGNRVTAGENFVNNPPPVKRKPSAFFLCANSVSPIVIGMSVMYRCWAEVDLAALRGNLAWIRHRAGPAVRVMAVVKADAYGHGLKQIAGLLMQSGADGFGVANLSEAQSIRSVGQGWPILMLGACLPHEVETAVRDDVTATVSSAEEVKHFASVAARLGKVAAVHVKVDTGMGRLGVEPPQAQDLVALIGRSKHLRCDGIYTHYSSAEDERDFSRAQATLFEDTVKELERAKLRPPFVHANNSAALLHEPSTIYNLIRPGLLMYGLVPPGARPHSTALPRKVSPTLAFKCRVSYVKTIRKGTPLSYGRSFVAPRKMTIATVTAGYGDGYLRSGSNRTQVLIQGRRCRVVGRITMDQTLVDVSRLTTVKPGEEVVLAGRQREEEITFTELAGWCGTVPWEMLTAITYRVPRVYLGGQAS
jgi:alanine racemase